METTLSASADQLAPGVSQLPSVPAESIRQSLLLRCVRHLAALLLALIFGAGSLWLYTRGNDFPALYYHPDEYGKSYQIMGRMERNFNHPLLLLEAAEKGIEWFDVPVGDLLRVTIAGRWASAVLASVGVIAVTLAGYAAYGFIGLFITGAVVSLCPALLINAHFFKEDTSLLCGIMLTMLGARYTLSAQRVWSQLLAALVLGIGCGAAVSGKYVGAITTIPAILALFIGRMQNAYALPLRTLLFCLTFIATAHFINSRAFESAYSFKLTPEAQSGFYDETHHAVEGHFGLGLRQPNSYWLRIASTDVLPHLWILGGIAGVWCVATRRITRWEIVLLAFIATFGAILSFNKIPMARYALPVTVGLYVLIAQLISSALVDLSRRGQIVGLTSVFVCLGVIGGIQGSWARDLDDRFVNDTRHEFRNFVANTIPAGTRIACDNHSGLTSPGDPIRHPDQPQLRATLRRDGFMHVADIAETVDDLARQGYSYVAVSSLNFDRFFDREVAGVPGNEDWFKRHRQFYEDVFTRGKLVWKSEPKHRTNAWVDIDLRLYDIRNLKPANQSMKSE